MVAPDEGSVKRCTSVANDLNLDFALITNRKPKDKKKSHQRRRDYKSNTSAYNSRQQSVEPEDSQSEGGASTKGSESDAGTSGLQVLTMLWWKKTNRLNPFFKAAPARSAQPFKNLVCSFLSTYWSLLRVSTVEMNFSDHLTGSRH